ncbi:MAG: hypothetical protein V3T70_05855, partial [Phycisphaerae bacterium]
MPMLNDTHSQRSIRSALSPRLRAWHRANLVLCALIAANTLYLMANRGAEYLPPALSRYFAEQEHSIPRLFQVMILSHTGLGALTVLSVLIFAGIHLPRVWKRHRRPTVASGIVLATSGVVLAVTGPFIVYAAASRDLAWVWWMHVAAAALAPVAFAAHRNLSLVRPAPRSYAKFAGAALAMTLALLVWHGFTNRGLELTHEAQLARQRGNHTGPGSRERDLATYLEGSHEPANVKAAGFISESFVPPGSPFFPSAATTTTGDYLPERIITRGDTASPERLASDLDEFGFVVNEQIGAETCARCHPDTTAQWAASAHRFASFNNPFYEATINDMRESAVSMNDGIARHVERFPQWKDRAGPIKSKWCSGCHDPAIMLAGRMTEPIDRRTAQAQAGLTCLACHAIDRIHNNTGNSNYNIADEQEDPYLFATAPGETLRAFLHDTAIKARPDVHKRQMLKPFFRTSEFCATCHKVSIQEPVNSYHWLRAQNEYDNWHDSGVALNAARTFYLPPAKRVCQDCHMPPEDAPLGDVAARNGKVRSHRFLAVNTALPFIRGDTETIERIEAFLHDEKLRIDVFALVRDRDDDTRQTTYALNRTRPVLRPGETVTLDVVVRNVGVGHTFPGGTNDSNQGWIELRIMDEAGQTLLISGDVRPDHYVDPAAHFFRAVLVDRHGNAIRRRNAPDIYTTIYSSVIGPGTAHAVHYRFPVPSHTGGKLTIRARLLWRKFDRAYSDFTYRTNPVGFKRFKESPELPITEICRDEVALTV